MPADGLLDSPSSDVTLDVPAEPSAAAVDVPAETPAVEPQTEAPEAPVDHSAELRKVVEEAVKDAAPEPEAPEAKADEEPAPDGQAEAQPEAQPDEDEKLPFGKHPRWKQVLGERNEARAKLEELAPKAEQYGHIERFMDTNGLSTDEVVKGFKVMALMKTDPVAARQALQEYIDMLDPLVGNVLPDDLRGEVDEGYVTEERARELARLRASQQLNTQRQQHVQQQLEQQRLAQQQEQQVASQRSAVLAWESQTKARDPDYDAKKEWVVPELRALMVEHQPTSPEQMVQLCQTAYDNVSKRLARTMPRRPEVRPAASSTSSATTSAQPAPKSFHEAVARAFEQASR